MHRILMVITLALVSLPSLADDPEDPKELDPGIKRAEAEFERERAAADKIHATAMKKATDKRLKAYQDRLAYHTKNGDFDKASAVKGAIAEFEKTADGPVRPKVTTVKFDGHEYALIKDQVTWHVAKQRCEEMGGYLCVLKNAEEDRFICSLVGTVSAWVGCTDEAEEGEWKWVKQSTYFPKTANIDGNGGVSHCLTRHENGWHDGTAGERFFYVCEWDN